MAMRVLRYSIAIESEILSLVRKLGAERIEIIAGDDLDEYIMRIEGRRIPAEKDLAVIKRSQHLEEDGTVIESFKIVDF